MTDTIKICPGCDAEYYAHIEWCRDCEIELPMPGEETATGGAEQGASAAPGQKHAIIEKGDIALISELAGELNTAGVPFQAGQLPPEAAAEADGCSDGSCAPKEVYAIAVTPEAVDAAQAIIKKFFDNMDPEIKEARARMEQGLCPGCGTDVRNGGDECPECGLNLDGTGGGGGGCK